MIYELALKEFEILLRNIRDARSPLIYCEDPLLHSLIRNAKNLMHTYASLINEDFSKDLIKANKALGNNSHKLSHLEPLIEDIVKHIKRIQTIESLKKEQLDTNNGRTLTTEIQRYLQQSNESEAALFLNDCVIENIFIDFVSGDDGQFETELHDVRIMIPVNRYKSLDGKSDKIQTIIDDSVREFAQSSGRLVNGVNWIPYLLNSENDKINSKTLDIERLLTDSLYVSSKIEILKNSLEKTPHLAIGTSKELIEVCCKGILQHHKIEIDKLWDLPRLVKETNKVLQFNVDHSDEQLKNSIKLITGGLANIVHGVAEIRNQFGSGHGHNLNFKELDKTYANLAVFSSIELITFYLRIFKSQLRPDNSN